MTTIGNRYRSNLLIALSQSESVKQALQQHLSIANTATLSATCKHLNEEFKPTVVENQRRLDKQDLDHLYLAVKENDQELHTYSKQGENTTLNNNSLYFIVPKYGSHSLYVYNLDKTSDKLHMISNVYYDQDEEYHDGPIFDVLNDRGFTVIASHKQTGIFPTHKIFLALSVLDEVSFLTNCVIANDENKKLYKEFADELKQWIEKAMNSKRVLTYTDYVSASVNLPKQKGGKNPRRKLIKRF